MLMSSTKLEIRAEQVLPGSWRGGGNWGQRVGAAGQGREMNQAMYAHVNK
jgi:hypothetical protein